MVSRAQELLSRIGEVEDNVEHAQEGARKLRDRDRSRIAALVIYLYVGMVSASFLFIIGLFFVGASSDNLCGDPPGPGCIAWKESAEFLLQVLTTTVLPIVTLVLGYYFGTAKAEAD
ncbi:MAG: hypothetical protein M3365_08580 [Gemmatimonadota bacterium]|nr:hypothetical protein [Gemmatimonadota bacterium]